MSETLASMPEQVGMTPIYILVGSLVLKEAISTAREWIKGAFAKNEKHEDADKKEMKDQLKAHEQRFNEQDDAIDAVERSVERVQGDLKTVQGTLESIRGGIAELRAAMETNRERQADFYRAQLKDFVADMDKKLSNLEFQMRQDSTRSVGEVMRELQAMKAAMTVRARGRRATD